MKNGNRKKPVRKGNTCKPPKPYPSFPLTPHASGKWMKKIRGKIHYFGRWGKTVEGLMERIPGDGWEEALSIYKAQAEPPHAALKPRDGQSNSPASVSRNSGPLIPPGIVW